MDKMCIVLLCPGNLNFGDNAILHTWLKVFASVLSQRDEVVILGAEPGYVMQFVHEYPFRITITDALHRYVWNHAACTDNAEALLDSLLDCEHFSGDRFEPAITTLNQLFTRASFLHVLGGGVLNYKWKDQHIIFAAAVRLADKYRKEIVLTGQTIGPLCPEDEVWLRPWFSKASLIDLRDECSLSYLKTCCENTIVTVDDTFLLDLLKDRREYRVRTECEPISDGPHINVCVHGWNIAEESYTKAIEVLAAFLQGYWESHTDTRLFLCEFSPTDRDVEYAHRLQECLKGEAKENCVVLSLGNYSTEFGVRLIQSAVMNIGTRFHMAVFSLLAGRTTISLILDDYYQVKLNGIHSLFSSSACFPVGGLTMEMLNGCLTEEKPEKVDAVFDKRPSGKLFRYYKATEACWSMRSKILWRVCLGYCYENSLGVEQNLNLAAYWYDRAGGN